MKSISRSFAAACAVILTMAAAPSSNADELSSSQRSEVERIVREYLIAHPEVLQEAMNELDKRQTAVQAEKHKAAIKQYSDALFSSPRQVVLGNPNGNVTFVEFFDYNCGYCKRAMDDMLTLLKDDPKLKEIRAALPPALLRRLSGEDQQRVTEFLTEASLKPISHTDMPELVLSKFTEKDGTIGKLVLVV